LKVGEKAKLSIILQNFLENVAPSNLAIPEKMQGVGLWPQFAPYCTQNTSCKLSTLRSAWFLFEKLIIS